MFDLSFFELLVIGAVALVVIGPERLPRVARTAGQWVGKIQRYVSDVKNDINREMEIEELRRLKAEMNETARSVEATARSMESSLRQQTSLDLDDSGAAKAAEAESPAGAADETLASIPAVPGATEGQAPVDPESAVAAPVVPGAATPKLEPEPAAAASAVPEAATAEPPPQGPADEPSPAAAPAAPADAPDVHAPKISSKAT